MGSEKQRVPLQALDSKEDHFSKAFFESSRDNFKIMQATKQGSQEVYMAAQLPQEFNGTITFMNFGSEKMFPPGTE